MKDFLNDILKHTVPLGCFERIRVDGADSETEIASTEPGKNVVMRGKLHSTLPDFKGVFGIPNLGLLNTILNIPEYADDKAVCTMIRNDRDGVKDQPVTIHFENNDFNNDFRLMTSKMIDSMEPKLQFKVNNWPITFTPSVSAMTRLKYQSNACSDETHVTFNISNGEVKAQLGDASTHSGSFIFQSGVDKSYKKSILIPLGYLNSVFALVGDKTMYIGDLGVMVSVDSGLAKYDYIFPAASK